MEESIKNANPFWRYFGAMLSETKDGKQAVSYTRVLGLILFLLALWMWSGRLGGSGEVPESMLYTLWGLIGVKSARDITSIIKQ